MRRIGLIVMTGVGALVLAGCATMSVSSYIERGTDFAQFRTFAWGPADALPTGDPRLDNNAFFRDYMEGAVERNLAVKGYAQIPADMKPDLLIHYHANVSQRFYVDAFDRQFNCTSADNCDPKTIEYEAGTLMIDVTDTRTNRVVWRGWAQDSYDGVINNQDRLAEKVEESVRRILEQMPNATRLTTFNPDDRPF
jgi:hypothetical protein